jgi:Mn2+/Fe2+ NRAMP family transporter
MTENTKRPPKRNIVVRFFSNLGPGLITGAADDDPSGVATYSIAGCDHDPCDVGRRDRYVRVVKKW